MQATYHFPTDIRFGPGVISELGSYLKAQKLDSPLLVTDPICATLPFFQKIVQQLEESGLQVTVFSDIHKNPVKSDVEKGADAYHALNSDSIIGIGGGASLDVARAIALKVHHPGDLFDYEDDSKITKPIPYFITVPTTSGTGSEVGRCTVIGDDETKQKKILFSPRLMAKIVFADPELTLDLPPHVTAATGMDALTHNIEAYLSKGEHPMCDGIALEAIRMIWKHLPEATLNPTLESRTAMMHAALMGAVAFQKGLGIVHSLAHPLSTVYDLHHGLANAIMLPHGIRFNIESVPERIEHLKLLTNAEDLPETLRQFAEKLQLPVTLGQVGVQEGDIERLSTLAVEDVCHECNPRSVAKDDFVRIYREAMR